MTEEARDNNYVIQNIQNVSVDHIISTRVKRTRRKVTRSIQYSTEFNLSAFNPQGKFTLYLCPTILRGGMEIYEDTFLSLSYACPPTLIPPTVTCSQHSTIPSVQLAVHTSLQYLPQHAARDPHTSH